MSTELQKLQSTIQTMDSMSQDGFSEISTLAGMALKLMETKEAYLHPENIAQVLKTIRDTALEAENLINCEAEDVGCNYKDAGADRRNMAHLAAKLGRNGEAS